MERSPSLLKLSIATTQTTILLICLGFGLLLKANLAAVLFILVVLEGFAVAGLLWGRRLQRKAEALPLQRR